MAMSVTMSKKTLFIKGITLFIFILFITMSAIPVTSGKLAVKVNRENIKVKNKSTQETFFEVSPSEQWNKTFGGNNSDRGFYCEQTSNEGYIIMGHTWSYGHGGYDVWLIRADADGNEEWNKTFGGENDDVGISVHFTIDDGYIIAGSTDSYGAGNSDVWLIKTDAFGNEEWNKTFGKEYNDWGWSVHQTIDNGYVITGIIEPYEEDVRDLWLIKTDANGNEEWNKTFGGVEDDYGYSVQQTSGGGYLILGETNSYGSGSGDAWLIKTDTNGTELWNKTFGGTGQDSGISMQIEQDKGYIITGITRSFGLDDGDVWLIRTDVFGNEQWNRTFGGTSYDCGASIDITDDGDFIMKSKRENPDL